MLVYKKKNVNPKGKRVGDCSTRALVGVLDITYEQAIKEQCEAAIETCYGLTDKDLLDHIMAKYGYIKMKQPKKANGKKYTVKEIDELLTEQQMKDGVLVKIAHHFTCIKDGELQDIWDCGYKTIGNYLVKEK